MPYRVDALDPKKTAMIVVDMQNDFVAEGAAPAAGRGHGAAAPPNRPNIRTSRSRRPVTRATPRTRIRSAACIRTCSAASTRSGPERMFWGTDITRMPWVRDDQLIRNSRS